MKSCCGIVALAVIALMCGCVTEQERREAALVSETVGSIKCCLSAGNFDEALRLCDEGKKKCPTVEYDWDEAKAVVARHKEAAKDAARKNEYKAWLLSDDGKQGVSIEEFESTYKSGWNERAAVKLKARLEKEALEKAAAREKAEEDERVRNREALVEKLAKEEVDKIRNIWERGKTYTNLFSGEHEKGDWIKTWTKSRRGMSEADVLAGDSLLAEFGSKYMPNAFANYEKAKSTAIEFQQIFNEEFKDPESIGKTDPTRVAFDKFFLKFAKARMEYFLCRDELCHYWTALQLGVLTADDLTKADSRRLAVALLPEEKNDNSYRCMRTAAQKADDIRDFYLKKDGKITEGVEEYLKSVRGERENPNVHIVLPESKILAFAEKYASESYALFRQMEQAYKSTRVQWEDVQAKRRLMDAVRYDRNVDAAVWKMRSIAVAANVLGQDWITWQKDHRTLEKTSDDVAKCDHERALRLKTFVESLPCYIKNRVSGPIIPKEDMIQIPKRGFRGMRIRMQRTEVTQMQWMLVMGKNPAKNQGADHPVENVTAKDVATFLSLLNDKEPGARYSIPMDDDWEYARLAGRENEQLRFSQERCHFPVALVSCNPWRLYDMSGNVDEIVFRRVGENASGCGTAGCRNTSGWEKYGDNLVGLRLVCYE